MTRNHIREYLLIKKEYKDPDSFKRDLYNAEFYKQLHDGLNKLQNDIFTIEQSPKNIDDFGIFMKDNKVQLKSDQFGFSVLDSDSSNGFYPYDAYLCLLDNNRLDKGIKKVKKWIEETRKPGGSFLWPIEKKDKKCNPEYNKKRGGKCNSKNSRHNYIQDRVDLTLYEIKEFYDNLNGDKKNNKKNNILFQCVENNPNLNNFLKRYKTFSNFSDLFGFTGNFVVKENGCYRIIDIFRSNLKRKKKRFLNEKRIIELRDNKGELNDFTCQSRKGRRDTSDYKSVTTIKEFENMFDNICELIEKRRKKYFETQNSEQDK